MLRNTLASGVFPTRIPLRSTLCQGVPKSTLENTLAPGAKWPSPLREGSSWGPGQFEPRSYAGYSTELVARVCWMATWLWLNSNLLLTREASEKLNSVYRGGIRELKKERHKLYFSKGKGPSTIFIRVIWRAVFMCVFGWLVGFVLFCFKADTQVLLHTK